MLLRPPESPFCSYASVSRLVFSLTLRSWSSPSLHCRINLSFLVRMLTFSPSFSGWSLESRFSNSSLRIWKFPIFCSYSFSFLYSLCNSTSRKCCRLRSFSNYLVSYPTTLILSCTIWMDETNKNTFKDFRFTIKHVGLELLHLKMFVKTFI